MVEFSDFSKGLPVPQSIPSQPYIPTLEGTTAHSKGPGFKSVPPLTYQWKTRFREGRQPAWAQHAGSAKMTGQLSGP